MGSEDPELCETAGVNTTFLVWVTVPVTFVDVPAKARYLIVILYIVAVGPVPVLPGAILGTKTGSELAVWMENLTVEQK